MPEYKYYEDYEIGEKQVTSSRTMTEADIRLFIGLFRQYASGSCR